MNKNVIYNDWLNKASESTDCKEDEPIFFNDEWNKQNN